MDILDYINWRGDIDFINSPFNEVDALILSQLMYLDFKNLVDENLKNKISLADLSQNFFNSSHNVNNLGIIINPKTRELLELCGKSKRFSQVSVSGYQESFDSAEEFQFCGAIFTIPKPKTSIIVFRGTDDTLIGWKEDLNMVYAAAVPSQILATEYVEKYINNLKGEKIICGHSKGGNLAVYAAAFCSDKSEKQIHRIYNFDGPGFNNETLDNGDFETIQNKVCTFIPQESFIGLLLEQTAKHRIVTSDEKNALLQHDAFTWNIGPRSFITTMETKLESKIIDNTLSLWIKSISKEKRKNFVDAVYKIFTSSGSTTLTEVVHNIKENPLQTFKNLVNIDAEYRQSVSQMLKLLFKAAKTTIPGSLSKYFEKNQK